MNLGTVVCLGFCGHDLGRVVAILVEHLKYMNIVPHLTELHNPF